jgi:hypothetical protein
MSTPLPSVRRNVELDRVIEEMLDHLLAEEPLVRAQRLRGDTQLPSSALQQCLATLCLGS